ncbi:MAG: DEAD/DEAH box helicase family protein [Candidatus Dormibacteraeota bacterium]|nr:DEAD/DEAH box helicase family protein [Candidatus Dormibacteraeota bacterium]
MNVDTTLGATVEVARLRDVPLRRRYSTGRADLMEEFFRPCLAAAGSYDRAVGFFSSTFYLLVGVTMAGFAHRAGKMRIVCCPRLSEVDIAAMREGYGSRAAGSGLVRELEECLEDPVGQAVGRLLATLIAYGTIDLRIAFRPGVVGIYHDKLGIFTDAHGDRVSFDGSANESWSAWSGAGNYEAFHAFSSWADPERVGEDVEYFESLWNGRESGLEVIPFPDVAQGRLQAMVDPEGIIHAEQRVRAAVEAQSQARSSGRPELRRHQRTVLEDWSKQSHRGIVEHATASGKTITALTAAGQALEAGIATLIVVPTVTLVEQWLAEARGYFGNTVQVMLAGSGHDEWRAGANLRNFLEPGARRLVIVTIDTAATEDFTKRLGELHPLCLIVDEVHNAGSPQRRQLLELVDADWRLGLSATWQREGDPIGTAAILDYFEHVLEPVYGLQHALDDGYLCPYRYVIHPLSLTDHERDEWARQTVAIGRALGAARGEVTESVLQQLIRRARIIKKASGKPQLAADVLRDSYREGDAWLVYCDDTAQLRDTRLAIEAAGLRTMEYHRQAAGAEEEALAEFERTGGIMLAIKCLDEGVDIPRIDHALILASSTTRREFIQRRGRVLRRADRKYQAEIHDVLVDAEGFTDASSATFLLNEVARAREFASSARDSIAARLVLDRWERHLVDLGLQTYTGAAADGRGFEQGEGDN